MSRRVYRQFLLPEAQAHSFMKQTELSRWIAIMWWISRKKSATFVDKMPVDSMLWSRCRPVSYTHLDVYKRQLLKHAKGLMALTNPLVNSYKRLVPGYEAPVHIAWSSINRSPLIRIPATRGTGRRIELRSPDPAGNPYLVLAACLAAGLEGLKEKKMPMPNVDKNIFEMTAAEKAAESIEELPLNLFDAVKELSLIHI